MSKIIHERLLADAGRVGWLYNHSDDAEAIKKALKVLRKTLTDLEKTLEKEGSLK